MDRREFVKRLGAGGLLVTLSVLGGVGCPPREPHEPPMVDPDPPPPAPDEAVEGQPVEDGVEMLAICPNCGAENEVPEWGRELTCWNCGFVWTPERPV